MQDSPTHSNLSKGHSFLFIGDQTPGNRYDTLFHLNRYQVRVKYLYRINSSYNIPGKWKLSNGNFYDLLLGTAREMKIPTIGIRKIPVME